MAGKEGKSSKRKRDHKVSRGVHGGGGKTRLTELEKALMGKGVLARYRAPLPRND